MPRLLPRLCAAWSKVRDKTLQPQPPRPPSPPRQKPQPGTRLPVEYALKSLSVEGRTQSLLLESANAVKRRRDYKYRKAPSPKVSGQGLVRPRIDPVRHALPAETRCMTPEERKWWSSPYCKRFMYPAPATLNFFNAVRMLSGPMRRCIFVQRLIPKGSSLACFASYERTTLSLDFMVRMTAVQVPASHSRKTAHTILVPDLVEHPRFKAQKGRLGYYVICRKSIMQQWPHRCMSYLPIYSTKAKATIVLQSTPNEFKRIWRHTRTYS
jgi:hypothetical protein